MPLAPNYAGLYAVPMTREQALRLGIDPRDLERMPIRGGDPRTYLELEVSGSGNVINGHRHRAPARFHGLYLHQVFELVGAPYPHDDKWPSPRYRPDYLCAHCRLDMNTNPELSGQIAQRLNSLEVVHPMLCDVKWLLMCEEASSERSRMKPFNARMEIKRAWEAIHDALTLIEHQLLDEERIRRGDLLGASQVIDERARERGKRDKEKAEG